MDVRSFDASHFMLHPNLPLLISHPYSVPAILIVFQIVCDLTPFVYKFNRINPCSRIFEIMFTQVELMLQ